MENESDIRKKPSRLWYLLPIFLNAIGGIIGYFLLKDRDRKFAERLLIVGLVMIAVWFILSFLLAAVAYLYIGGLFKKTTSSLILLIDANCNGEFLNVIVSNEGTDKITVSSLKFYVNGIETTPTCGGNPNPAEVTIDPHNTMGCGLGHGLSGTVKVTIVGPSNKVDSSVQCK